MPIKKEKKTGQVTRDFKEFLLEQLRDPAEAMAYLNASLEDKEHPGVFLLALRDVAEAHGMRTTAKKSGLNREGFYQMLSKRGNPTILSLFSILKALGLVVRVSLPQHRRLKRAA